MTQATTMDDIVLSGINPAIYTEDDFREIARMVRSEAGIVLSSGKAMLVYSRIAPLVRESSSTTFAEYIATLRHNDVQRRKTIEALTTNHTFFFRESHHFDHLGATVRPLLAAQLERDEPVRIWSAGCSSGEETWSLVLTLLGEDTAAGRKLVTRDLRVLASDLSPRVLAKAAAARYAGDEVGEVPERLRANWMRHDGQAVVLAEEARSIVRFRELNLLGEWPMQRAFDVIFCRNVMIYFDQPTKERLVSRFAEYLRPGGFLYIGHSERVSGPGEALLEPVGPTIYRRRGA